MAIRRGMLLFRQGDVLGSLVEFDKAIELDTRQKAYLWQRGLSLYYVDRFEEGADQFRIDVAQNPNDTEESIWCFLCEAQLYGVDEARKRFLEVLVYNQEWRSIGIQDPLCGKLITCLKMAVTQKSLPLHFQMDRGMSIFMHLYMPVYIMKLRKNQRQPKFK